MTPEEKAFEVVAEESWEDDSSGDNVRHTDYDKLRALIAQAIREAKIEAYDEAIRTADDLNASAERGKVVERIRTLKDSLVSVEGVVK
jgi:predicted lipid-binding transport protein (Tim44 family)